jgi:trk system potassium uptake protein TrkA
LPERWSGRAVLGSGFNRDHLHQAEIEKASALAAVTNGDNTNILTARIARETYEVPNVVARIYDPRRAIVYQRLGIPTVATVTWTTQQVLRRIFPETNATEWTDPSGNISIIERALPPAWAGRRLSDLEMTHSFHLVGVMRAGLSRLVEADLVGQEGDLLYIAVTKDALEKLEEVLSPTEEGPHR